MRQKFSSSCVDLPYFFVWLFNPLITDILFIIENSHSQEFISPYFKHINNDITCFNALQ